MSFPTISPSDIDNFEGCPKRWHMKRILKDPAFKFQVTEATTYGQTVHDQLEKYVKYSTELPDHLEYIAPFIDGLREAGYTLYAELECAITRDWKAVGFWDKSAWLRGKIDLVALNFDAGNAVIVDWKTGKRKAEFMQLQTYGMILYTCLGLKQVDVLFAWLKTKQNDREKITSENIDEIREDISQRIDAIKEAYESNNFPARTSPLCEYCAALDGCGEAIYWKVRRDRKRR